MLDIQTWRDPYDMGFSTTRLRQIHMEQGLTVLVGCNGIGKTTLLNNIKDEIKNKKIPFLFYDNLKSGGGNALSEAIHSGNFSFGAELMSSSEGECIKMNFGSLASKVREFLKTGVYETRMSRFAKIFAAADEDKQDTDDIPCNIRVLLFDAIDSGLSVDSVAEVRDVFNLILEDSKKLGVETYIIASANEYELARSAPCFDVASGQYVDIPSYEDYRNFVIKSREKKDKRIERARKTGKL